MKDPEFQIFWKNELAAMGLSEYNPWAIVRKPHGLMYNDYT